MISTRSTHRAAGARFAPRTGMSQPRQILPNQFYMLTRRTTQRQYWLRPDPITTAIFIYCLAEAAARFKIDILLTMAESNHHHTICYDRRGTFPQFVEHFHKLVARCLNERWGRTENLWSSEEPCITRLLDYRAILAKLAYAAANPVKDLLVQRAVQWPGANGYRALITGRTMKARRPHHFFSASGVMPDEVELELVIPDVLGPRDQVIAELRARVEQIEHAMLCYRSKTGRRILGRARAIKQAPAASPTSASPPRELRPRFAGHITTRIPALIAYREFLVAHREARIQWLATGKALFPAGTYYWARVAPISIAPERHAH